MGPEDTKDGLPLYVVKVTDESVPDKDKQYVAYFNAHAAEPCGKEGTPRFLEDLLIWRDKDPGHVLDDGDRHRTAQEAQDHRRRAAAQDEALLAHRQPDGWAAGDGVQGTGANYNYAGANSNRVAYQDGWVFPLDPS